VIVPVPMGRGVASTAAVDHRRDVSLRALAQGDAGAQRTGRGVGSAKRGRDAS
jgi:hypothetical protein